MIDRGLESLLTRTARAVEYPVTPDLRSRVMPALQQPPRIPQPLMRRPAFGLALLVVAVTVIAALAITPSRDAIARLFGVEGSRIEFLPTPLPGETPTPFPTTVTSGVVSAIDLAEIPQRAGFEAALPDVPEPRLSSAIVFYGGQPVVMHHYESFDLWQTRLEQNAGFGKGVPEGGVVEEVDIILANGLWLTGADHFVYYYDAGGTAHRASQRTVTRSTLIWRTDAFFYRIETDLSLEEALRIAVTLP
jgi:hypothetical protein